MLPTKTTIVTLLLASVTLSYHTCNANILSNPTTSTKAPSSTAAFQSSKSFLTKSRNIPPAAKQNPYTPTRIHTTISKTTIISHLIKRQTTKSSSSTSLHLARYDNLLSGLSEISIGFALGTLYSEYAILTTKCGPSSFSDTLERLCYQGVIVTAGASIFCRIAFGKDLMVLCQEWFGELEEVTLKQVNIAEVLSLMGVVGAFVALGVQIGSGERMDGLSGIDVEMCRAIRDL